jgi:sulfide dehydrogenase cytochrome subunit
LTSQLGTFYPYAAKGRLFNDPVSGKYMKLPPSSTRAAILAGLLAALAGAAPARAQAPLAAEGCTGCHGPNGAGAGGVPTLAGRDAAELRALMAAFRANERPATIMGRVARGYTEAEIAAVAEHFAQTRR